ncbi:MAG: hypoxanthine phosphoribosyltransferase [Planctomycetota bacterium]
MSRAESGTFAPYPPLVGAEELRECVEKLAAEILPDFSDEEPVVAVAVMKGAIVFLADLIRYLPMPLEVELLDARSYRGTHQQRVDIVGNVEELRLTGRKVLVVDCVLDSGRTLAAVQEALKRQEPARLATCVLLSKRRERAVDVAADYVGMEIPDVFVVGYGLDYNNRWRHLPYVAELPEQARTAGGNGR